MEDIIKPGTDVTICIPGHDIYSTNNIIGRVTQVIIDTNLSVCYRVKYYNNGFQEGEFSSTEIFCKDNYKKTKIGFI